MSGAITKSRRKRSRIACEPCRERKRRCTGGNPCTTCNDWGYDCYYEAQSRTRPGVPAHTSSTAPTSSTNFNASGIYLSSKAAPPDPQSIIRNLESNSGAAFVRKMALKIDPVDAPKLKLFGWNVGARELDSDFGNFPASSIVDIISQSNMKVLADNYFAKVDPCYGFLDRHLFYQRLEVRWQTPSYSGTYDSVLAGVAALGSLFSQVKVSATELQLVELARSILDVHRISGPPSLDLITGWTLRVVYMRMTTSPHAMWIASSTLMHLLEASGLSLELPVDTVFQRSMQCDSDIRSRLIGVAQHLNTWTSFDIGLSRVSIPNCSVLNPSPRPGDYTTELLKILPVSTGLDPGRPQDDAHLESLLVQTLDGVHTQPPSVLGQCNLVLCIFRRLRVVNLNTSPALIERILALLKHGLHCARTMVLDSCPWHHTANIPFQVICILLEMDTSASLGLLPDAMQTLKLVASIYDTKVMREAYSTACLLILLYHQRRTRDMKIFDEVLGTHCRQKDTGLPPRQPSPNDDEVSWLESLVNEMPSLQDVDIEHFLNADMIGQLFDIEEKEIKMLAAYPWVSSPFIVGAPMRVMSGPALAIAVSSAGGLGFIGPHVKTESTFTDLEVASAKLQEARLKPTSLFNSLPPTYRNLPVGVGFQMWSDDEEVAISTIRKFMPCATWIYAPRHGQEDVDRWSRRIRSVSPSTQIWVQIGTLNEARGLLNGSEQPDVIVVQGAEAGGHGRSKDGMGLITLLPEIADATAGSGIPLFAAGGIADGRGVAAALCLGASGVAMGTRFLAAKEARISGGYQKEIIRASDGAVNTVRTLLYNHLRGTFGWPEGYSPRTIINKSWKDHQAGAQFNELQTLHDHALESGDDGWGPEGRLATYAGASIGLVNDVRDAIAITQEVRDEALQKFNTMKG
ncbi:hypothetical protein K431DRAFT_254481 [Polychaeton citri CBS 116435]|uniref:Zn(2)-C6 fungal-type domain-containing protein n=1 Tax=Polychaeton citri CBS 116435 TaxID=1314669 RepID=A0A9P4ULJ9_9PEZI|nr:hypothetical protein K431DRAFT_254481 [Polychaeton citri CBS 116435]